MREIELVGLSDDQQFLVARDPSSGEQLALQADHRTLSQVAQLSRAPRPRPGRSETTMDMSPREIQTRVRRGETPEAVADAAGVDVERVMAYAIPVLAEREFMVEQARKTVVRRRHVGGANVVLGTLVDEQVQARGGSAEAAAWDSWRREDGRWTLTVLPEGATDPAIFTYDVQGRYVLPADQVAHDLVGDLAPPVSHEMAIADALRDAPASTQEPTVVEVVVEAEVDLHPVGVSSLKAARDRRAMEQMALAEEQLALPTEPEQDTLPEAEHDEPAAPAEPEPEQQRPAMAVPDDLPDDGPRKKRHERRRVPSWDEIMFGSSAD